MCRRWRSPTIEGGDTLINAAEAAGGIQIGGTAEIGSTLTVNGAAVTVDGTGHWTTSMTPSGQGALAVTAVATDAAGNPASTTTNLTVDTIAPAVAITTIEGGDTLINAAEAAGGIQISGTAEIGSTLTVNGAAVTVDGTGHWTTSVTPSGQGALAVTAVATDAAGNPASTTTNLTLDTIVPAVAITTIEGGDTLINAAEAAGGIQISGTAEIGSTLTVNGAAVTVDGTGHWTTSVTPAGQGALAVTAVATDAAGNPASTTTNLTVDTIAPAVAITSPGGPVNQAAQTITGTVDAADAGATVTIFDGSTAVGSAIVQGNGNWSSSVTLNNGSNSLTAQVTDLAGNTATSARCRLYAEHHRSGGDREPGVRYRVVGDRPHHLERCADRHRPCQHRGAFHDRRQRDRRHRDRRRPGGMVVHADRPGRWAAHHRGEPDRHVRQHRHGRR